MGSIMGSQKIMGSSDYGSNISVQLFPLRPLEGFRPWPMAIWIFDLFYRSYCYNSIPHSSFQLSFFFTFEWSYRHASGGAVFSHF